MSPNVPSIAPETLLAHAAWMRRLARSLVRDDAQADDVVQDAVVAALRSPPRDAVALPAWLAATVRNGARQLWRGERRRAAREESSARRGNSASAADVVSRAEEHGVVVQAVLALPEPYRATLLLRFYDDLPPREVAARTGVPVETARARIRRGLDQVRMRLDAAHGGDGRSWRLALTPLVLHKSAAAAGVGTGAAAGHAIPGAIIMAGTGAVGAVGVVALAVGVAAGWWLGATSSDAVAAKLKQSADDEKKQVETLKSDVAQRDERTKKLTSEVSTAESALRVSQKEHDELKTQFDEKSAALRAAKAALAKIAAASAPRGPKPPRFAFGQFAKLSDVDWGSVGENLNAMTPICVDVLAKLRKGGDMPGDELGKLQQHNGPLVAAGIKVMKEVPGTGVNGSFTHPAFMVNAIAATLDAAGDPLTDAEATALEALGRQYSDEDARRLQAYDASAYAIQKTWDEAELRRRFFDAAFAALTQEQRDTLTPPDIKGVLGFDVFSDGLLWMTVMRPLAFKAGNTDSLVAEATNAMTSGLKIPSVQQDAARAVVASWTSNLPASLLAAPTEPGAQYDVHVETVREAAKQTIALVERLVNDLKLEGAQADAARKWPAVLLPSPQKAD